MEEPPAQQEQQQQEKEEEEEEEILDDFARWLKLAEAPPEEATCYISDRPPEDDHYGSYYVPRILGPGDEPLPDMPWDNTGPNEEAKKIITAIIRMLSRKPNAIMIFFFERLPKNQALAGYYNYVFDLKTGSPWQLFEDLSHLKTGDVIEMAAHDWTLLIRTKAWCNIYEDPLEREKYWRIKQDEERHFSAEISKNMSQKMRIARLELWLARNNLSTNLYEKQRRAIDVLLMLHNKYKFNSDMHEFLRENVAHHERDIIELQKDVRALKAMYSKLLETIQK